MNATSNLVLNGYSIVLLTIIYFSAVKYNDKGSLQDKLFMIMLPSTILLIGGDILARFHGNTEFLYVVMSRVGNFTRYFMHPLLPSLWLLYVHYQIFQKEEKTLKLIYPLLVINAANGVITIISLFNGWYYYIDSNNNYYRGPLYFIPVLVIAVLLTLIFFAIIKNKKRIEKRYFVSLLFFIIPPLIGFALQVIVYEVAIILNSVVISLLVIYINIQSHKLGVDYLTRVYNRKKLEAYVEEKISESNENSTFSAIMIDINYFKYINDTFGHSVGDDALKTFAWLLKDNLRANDFVARYGGDEFYIILDTDKWEELEETVFRIGKFISEYNSKNVKPYTLDVSMGYSVYDYNSQMGVNEFLKYVDMLMYKNKQAYKRIKHTI